MTGAVTATGGAWNASIVAEVASWGNDTLVADGLGAYIAQVTEKGDQPAIYFSIVVMAIFVGRRSIGSCGAGYTTLPNASSGSTELTMSR